MSETEIKIVNTIKIQSIENGKRTTRRRFNLEVSLPTDLRKIVKSYVDDVIAEVNAEKRTPQLWVTLIKKHTRSKQLRGWAASIIWWVYGGEEENVLYKMSKDYDHSNSIQKVETINTLLNRMGCPRFISNDAATRERERSKAVSDYIKDNEPVRLGGRKK